MLMHIGNDNISNIRTSQRGAAMEEVDIKRRRAFGQALRAEREARGVSAYELSERCGRSPGWIGNWENYEKPGVPKTPFEAFLVEEELGVEPGSLTWLLGYVPAGAEVECTIPAAVAASDLPDYDKEVILSVWRAHLARASE